MTSIHDLSYEHQQLIEAMKSQLLIAFINRLGGEVVISASEVDDTGKYNCNMGLDPDTQVFTFTVVDKSTGEAICDAELSQASWWEVEKQRDEALNKVIWGFYEDEYPIYSDHALIKGSICELHEECAADEFNHIVERLRTAEDAIKLIARGNPKNGLPLSRDHALNLARGVLVKAGVKW